MACISPARVMQALGVFAWLLGGAMARPAAAQEPVPTAPASSFADLVSSVETDQPPVQPFNPSAWTGRTEYPLSEVIWESLFGKPDPDTWRPLLLSTLFSEGWNEAWVPSPIGSGGAPRQGWIDAADGTLYQPLGFFTFAQAFNQGPKGNAYLGAFTLFTPLSRRLELIINVPFVLRDSAASGLPIINPTGRSTFKSQTTYGDMSFTPRVLLHETKDFSLTTEMAVLVPTGNQPLEGKTALIPNVSFWTNFPGRWVVRGGIGDMIPVGGGGTNTLISQLAIGKVLTDHDVPLFGDFTLYVSAVGDTTLSSGQHTEVRLTPGLRTHLGRDFYFLAGLPTPVTTQRIGDIGMIFWFMKVW